MEVRSGTVSAAGRLLSVEKSRKQDARGNFTDVTEFSLVGDAGELRTFELTPVTSVRLAERDLNEEVGRYLNLIGSSRAADVRRMTLTATGSGEREIFVSYISEVPVWKSTYRILMPEKAGDKPLLQGWAVVDNTIGEDWTDVELSLVAGAPQSFVQNISQPYYVRRPEVALPESAQLTPQTHEAAFESEPAECCSRSCRRRRFRRRPSWRPDGACRDSFETPLEPQYPMRALQFETRKPALLNPPPPMHKACIALTASKPGMPRFLWILLASGAFS